MELVRTAIKEDEEVDRRISALLNVLKELYE